MPFVPGMSHVTPAGAPAGSLTVQASQVARTITILVPHASLGTPGSGWSFTVVPHGQDGFGEDGARTFTETPGTFTFGRCERIRPPIRAATCRSPTCPRRWTCSNAGRR